MASKNKKVQLTPATVIAFIVFTTLLIITVVLLFGLGNNDEHDLYRFENEASMSIESYREIQGTSNNVITRSSSVVNDLIAMDLDPDLFVRFANWPANRPDLRAVALAEYHFLRDGQHMFRKFIYLHVPFMFDSILNNHLRFALTFDNGWDDDVFIFDTRADENNPNANSAFGYGMNFVKTNNSRGLFVLELQRDFPLTPNMRISEIHSIDRMNRQGHLLSRNDQTVYMGRGVTEPFRATFDPFDAEHEQIFFNFNSQVFITENTIVEVSPRADADLEGDVWHAGPSGIFNNVVYRTQLFFFNFNTTVDIDKIHNLRIYFEFREQNFSQGWLQSGQTTTTIPWHHIRDTNGQIGRTLENEAVGLNFMPNNNVVFNAITSPASERFTDNEFAQFENVNRHSFDRYEHSVLFHQHFRRDNRYVLGMYRSESWGEVRGLDITTMTFETDGQMFTARVDITQDTGHTTYNPPVDHPNWIRGIGNGIANFVGWAGNLLISFGGIIGSTLGAFFGGFFNEIGNFGKIVIAIITIIAVVVILRFILSYIKTKKLKE